MFFNIKDYLSDNDHMKELESKDVDTSMFDNFIKSDINNLKIPNLVKIEVIGIAFLITSFIMLILGWLIYFNIVDIKSIVEAMKLCIN